MNRISISGYMGSDPKITTFDNGNRMASFRIATRKRVFDAGTQTWQDGVIWHNVRAYGGAQGGIINQLQSGIYGKGTYIVANGSMQYQDKSVTTNEGKTERYRISYIELRHPQDLEFVIQSQRQQRDAEKTAPTPSPATEDKPKYTTPTPPPASAPTPTLSESDMLGMDGQHPDEAEEEI